MPGAAAGPLAAWLGCGLLAFVGELVMHTFARKVLERANGSDTPVGLRSLVAYLLLGPVVLTLFAIGLDAVLRLGRES